MLKHLTKFSSVRLYVPKDLRSSDSRYSVQKAMEEVEKKFPDGLPLLDPVRDMKIKQEEFKVLFWCFVINPHHCVYFAMSTGAMLLLCCYCFAREWYVKWKLWKVDN